MDFGGLQVQPKPKFLRTRVILQPRKRAGTAATCDGSLGEVFKERYEGMCTAARPEKGRWLLHSASKTAKSAKLSIHLAAYM